MEVQKKKTTTTSQLKIHLLGRFLVEIWGRALPESAIQGRKARSLLKLIAQQRHAHIVRDQAMDVFWPDLDEDAAASQLYKAIHHIRKAFAGRSEEASEWIEITDNLIRLDPPGGVVTDVRQFEEKARDGLRDGSLSDLQAAVSIYRGDLLPMDMYAEWAEMPREHYRQLYLDVLVTLADQYEQRNDLPEAAQMLRLALEKDPALESAHRALMRIFAKRGQASRAYRQFDLCRDVLSRELAVAPSPETKAMLDAVRERRVRRHDGRVGLRAAAPTSISPMVNRTAECTEIEMALDRLASGEGGTLLVRGRVGIGKTRLIRELAARSRQRGFRVFTGSASEDAGKVAYGPFVEVVDAVLHRYPALQAHLPVEFGRLVPSFSGEGESIPHADELAAQGYLFAQLQRFLARLAGDGPLVIILDDLHAADDGSRALFNYLRRQTGKLCLLLAATTREVDGGLIPQESSTSPGTTILTLRPLTSDDHLGLLQQNAPASDLQTGTAELIYEISEGNPLFALELLRYRLQDPDHDLSGSGSARRSSANGSIPSSLSRIVERQLDGLSPAAHHLLFIAAVVGRQVPFDLLAAVWSGAAFVDDDAIFEPLEEVTRARLLEERGLDYSFHHALVRETIYASISEARRRALHALVARSLIDESPSPDDEPVEQIAHHLVRAGDTRQGVHYLVLAGERAREAYAHEDALHHFGEALDLLEDLRDSAAKRLKRDVLERVGDVYRASGKLEQSYDAYEEAVQLAEELPLSSADLVELHRKIALVAIFRTEIPRAERHLDLAFDLVGERTRARARLLIIKALQQWHLNRLEDSVHLAHEALELAESLEAPSEASQACEILAMTYLPLGQWEEGLKYEMQRQVYGWSPDIVVATDAHLCLWEYHVTGDQPFEQARQFMKSVAEQATQLGDLRCVAVCHYALGSMHLWRGESREAVQELDASLELHENVGSPAGMAYALARKAVLQTMRGTHDLGWKAVQDGIEHAHQAAVRDHCLQRLYGVGIWNRLEADDVVEAQALVEESTALLEESGACAACALELYPWLAYFYLHTGDIEKARRCGEEVGELAAKTDNPIGAAVAAMIQSNLTSADRDDDGALRLRQKAFELAEGAVSDASHSPVVHYLDMMTDQQSRLRHA